MNRVRKLFSLKGRISRKEYLVNYIVKPIALFFALIFVGIVSIGIFNEIGKKEISEYLVIFFLIVPTILLFISMALILIGAVKRFHDFAQSGWWGLTTLIPLLVVVLIEPQFLKLLLMPNPLFTSFFTGLFLIGSLPALFQKGSDGENLFGEDPLKNIN
jgi:uncharacterized membrane protein YhaH (DUF805 family)